MIELEFRSQELQEFQNVEDFSPLWKDSERRLDFQGLNSQPNKTELLTPESC